MIITTFSQSSKVGEIGLKSTSPQGKQCGGEVRIDRLYVILLGGLIFKDWCLLGVFLLFDYFWVVGKMIISFTKNILNKKSFQI